MSFKFATLIVGILLLANLSSRAQADSLVVWDRGIEKAVNRGLGVDQACQPSPYALYRQTCVSNELNMTLERNPFERLTDLDHLALFVNKYRNLNASQQIIPGIKFRVNLNLTNVYQQEAKLEARLAVRW